MDSLPLLRPKWTDDSQRAPVDPSKVVTRSGRKNISRACVSCREKKTKCDGREPSCSNCHALGKICSYKNNDGRRKDAWKSVVSDLEQRNEDLERVIGSLKCNSFPEAVRRLQQLREDSGPPPAQPSEATTMSTPPSTAASRAEPMRNETPSTVAESLGPECNNLPPQTLTRLAVSTFYSCGSTLFYVMSQEVCDKLIRRVYEHPGDVNKSETCGLCALAAVGSQYSGGEIPESANKIYFEYATSWLQDTVEEDTLMGMRASICLSMYLILVKSTSARKMIGSGLNIARWSMRKCLREISQEDRLEWGRVLRTLAFVECWLSSSLGYTLNLGLEEMSLVDELHVFEAAINPLNSISANLIQSHLYKIALSSAQIQSRLQHVTSISALQLQQLSSKLDVWHGELPHSLQLLSLISADGPSPPGTRRPLLFMHMVHISSRIILYERVIQVTLSQPSNQSLANQIFSLSENVHQLYASFAQQLARIVGLLYEDHSVLSQCWLTIHACFHSSLALLLTCARSLALGTALDFVQENLSYVHDCLLVLDICKERDIAAMEIDQMIAPLHRHLQQIFDGASSPGKTGSLSPQSDDGSIHSVPSQLEDIVCQLMSAMRTPYEEFWV